MMTIPAPFRMDHHRRPSLLVLGLLLALMGASLPAEAQPNLRSTFPGRRVGGATRGECSARLIAHLVPSNSVFAPGETRVLGIVEGPSANPRPIQVSFRPEGSAAGAATQTLSLPAAGVGIVLFKQPQGSLPLRWESSYQCDAPAAPSDDPLAFVSAGSPPALSLLVQDATGEDVRLQQALQSLRKACGGSIARAELASTFALADVIKEDWPAQLPVRCPN